MNDMHLILPLLSKITKLEATFIKKLHFFIFATKNISVLSYVIGIFLYAFYRCKVIVKVSF